MIFGINSDYTKASGDYLGDKNCMLFIYRLFTMDRIELFILIKKYKIVMQIFVDIIEVIKEKLCGIVVVNITLMKMIYYGI